MIENIYYIFCFSIAFIVFFVIDKKIRNFNEFYNIQSKISLRISDLQAKKQSREETSLLIKILEKYNIIALIKNVNEEKAKEIKSWLQKAGFRMTNAVGYYLAIKISLCLFAFFLCLFLVTVFKISDEIIVRIAGPVGVMYLVYMLVDAHINSRIQTRQADIQKGIPNALDLLVICTEAGMSIDHALRRVGIEMDQAYPTLAEEFKLTVVELGVSSDREQVFKNLLARVDLPQMQAIVNSIIQSAEFGTPISVTLHTLSEEYRKERMLTAESKAARLPALMTLPLMFFILPTLFIVLIGPIIIKATSS